MMGYGLNALTTLSKSSACHTQGPTTRLVPPYMASMYDVMLCAKAKVYGRAGEPKLLKAGREGGHSYVIPTLGQRRAGKTPMFAN